MTDRLTHRSCSALFTPLHFALVKHVKRQIIRLRLAHILRRGGGAGSGHKDATLLSKPGACPICASQDRTTTLARLVARADGQAVAGPGRAEGRQWDERE